MKLIDLTGKTFGRLTVIERDYEYQRKFNYVKPYWKCKCECGNIVTVLGKSLREGSTRSCGCLSKEQAASVNFRDLSRQKFGKLTVIKYLGNSKWECLCDCGNKTIVETNHLITGHTASCGCIRSKSELFIKNWLRIRKINYITEYTIPSLRNKNNNLVRFDFAILDKNKEARMFIEYNGRQHYDKKDTWYSETVENGQEVKQKFCKDKNIPLYIIKYDENLEEALNKIDFSEVKE